MRVFYEEETETFENRYYVKIENVNVPDCLKGYKAIEASSVKDLKEKIIELYDFDRNNTSNNLIIELWSGQINNSKRLDILDKIPKGIEFISVRIINKVE
jgi:hypothetical protein